MTTEETQETQQGYKVHPLSAVVLVALDLLWTPGEVAFTITVVGLVLLCVLIGGVTLAAVTTIEKGMNNKTFQEALAIGFVVAILAAVPYPIVGSTAGIAFLTWAGLRKFLPSR